MLKLYVTMQNMFVAGVDRVRDGERGATAVEYGIMVSLIAVVIIGVVAAIGTNLTNVFGEVRDHLVVAP
ncbi:Flp family type IVb pilin [Specibacter sp. RAF43]|uniref:Flp family type IVb pilin n=1 Tax=Specibacter sp. RAF43 TaxID=3233057 RepID=UPI003F9B2A77